MDTDSPTARGAILSAAGRTGLTDRRQPYQFKALASGAFDLFGLIRTAWRFYVKSASALPAKVFPGGRYNFHAARVVFFDVRGVAAWAV